MWAPVAGEALLLAKPLRIMGSIPMWGVVWLPEKGAAKCDVPPCRGRLPPPRATHTGHLLLQGWQFTSIPTPPGEGHQGMDLQRGTLTSLGKPFWEDLAALLHFCYWDSNQDCAWKGWDFIFTFLLIVSSFFFSRQEFGLEKAQPLTANRHCKWNHRFSTSK